MATLNSQHQPHNQPVESSRLSDSISSSTFSEDDLPPFKYPKIDWEEWPEWETGASESAPGGIARQSSLDNTQYPDPAASHLLAEIGYASLPPPALEHIVPSQNGSPTPLHAVPHVSASHDDPAHNNAQLTERFAPQWIDLLRRAVEEPGLISEAYTRFHGYSHGIA